MAKLRVLILVVGILVLAAFPAYAVAAPVLSGGQGLDELQARARGVFEIEGVVFTDADEQTNRLVVGVVNRGLARAVEQRLSQLGVPLSSVDIVETQPIVFAATLQNFVRPLQGGLQITFRNKAFLYACTLGFNAIRSGVNGFVVNSHCTTKQGSVDNTSYYQPMPSTSNFIGNEIADPAYFKGGVCPSGKKCRYSDSAYAQRASGVTATLGSIEKTTGANNGSLTIAGSFSIVGEASATSGQSVNKVGRTTGWTQGLVTGTCVDTAVLGTSILLFCQTFVGAGVGGGDSGSPVFADNGDGTATLYGILWGGNTSGTSFVYSPIAQVEQELGALTTS